MTKDDFIEIISRAVMFSTLWYLSTKVLETRIVNYTTSQTIVFAFITAICIYGVLDGAVTRFIKGKLGK